MEAFKKELGELINKYSLENLSDTPDYILAAYLIDCLNTFGRTIDARRRWFSPGAFFPVVEIKQDRNIPTKETGGDVSPGMYKHFKGRFYCVITVAHHTETAELLVIYQNEKKKVFCRPLEMFTDPVTYFGKTTPRFKRVEEG